MPNTEPAHPRDRMVASAAVMLSEHGVRGTSFGRVIEHSGAPRGSISHHFPDGKHELIHAAVTAAGREITTMLRTAAEHGATTSGLIDAACVYFAGRLERTNYRAGCPVAAVAGEAFDDAALRAATVAVMHDWMEILTATLREEGRPAADADGLAQLTIAAIEGAVMMARVQRSAEPLVATRAHLIALLAP